MKRNGLKARVFAAFLTALFVFAVLPAPALSAEGTGPVVRGYFDVSEAGNGDVVLYSVAIDNPGALAVAEITVEYDTAALELIGFNGGGFWSAEPVTYSGGGSDYDMPDGAGGLWSPAAGQIKAYGCSFGYNGEGGIVEGANINPSLPVFEVSFTVLSTFGGNVIEPTITVGCFGTISDDFAYSTIPGSFTTSGSEVRPGDVSGDKKITLTDAVMISRYLAGWTMPTSFNPYARVRDSGTVTIADAVLISRWLAGTPVPELGPNP